MKKLQVLLVEDSPTDAELVLHELTSAGYAPEWSRVETEPDFLAALEKAPDIILSDYSMPQFSGLRALELLQASGLDIPLILISGTVGEDMAVEAMRRGAVDYLLKDRIARLASAVERALKEKLLRAERKQADEALRQSEARYRTLVKHFPNGGVVLFDHDLRFLLADGAGMADAGLVKEEVEGRTPRELFPAETCAVLEPHYRAALAGESRIFELSFADRFYESHTRPVRDPDGVIVGGMAMTQNITARRQAEGKIKAQLVELQRWREATLGREDRVRALKNEVNELQQQAGKPPRYAAGEK